MPASVESRGSSYYIGFSNLFVPSRPLCDRSLSASDMLLPKTSCSARRRQLKSYTTISSLPDLYSNRKGNSRSLLFSVGQTIL